VYLHCRAFRRYSRNGRDTRIDPGLASIDKRCQEKQERCRNACVCSASHADYVEALLPKDHLCKLVAAATGIITSLDLRSTTGRCYS